MIISIPIPEGTKCLLKIGTAVDLGQDFLEIENKVSVTIPLAKKFNIPAKDIFKHIKKFVGEPLTKGEILAVKKGFFTTTKILSEYEGTIKEIDHHEGHLVIETSTGEKNKLPAYFKGEIESINKSELKIKVKTGKEYPLKKTSGNFGGKAIYIEDSGVNSITADCNTAIGIAESFTSYSQSKTEALGIDGYISLNTLPEETRLPHAQIKQINDFKKIFEHKLNYCIINEKKSTIIFYQ